MEAMPKKVVAWFLILACMVTLIPSGVALDKKEPNKSTCGAAFRKLIECRSDFTKALIRHAGNIPLDCCQAIKDGDYYCRFFNISPRMHPFLRAKCGRVVEPISPTASVAKGNSLSPLIPETIDGN